jgi:general L-amino acid transport system substrate-binding protein
MTRGVRRAVCAVLALGVFLVGAIARLAAAADTLTAIRERGHIVCGVGDGPAGYSTATPQGAWSGIGVDFCRALAAGVMGSKDAVKFRALTADQQLPVLRAGEIDVLARFPETAPGNDTAAGIRIAGVLVHEEQGFMVRRSHNLTSALELSGARICVTRESGAGFRIAKYFTGLGMPFELVEFDDWKEAVAAYADPNNKACQVLSADLPELAGARQGFGDIGEHLILPELVAKRPVGPAVREGDDEWFSVVRWTLYALIAAEQLGITSASVDLAKGSSDAAVRRFLGIDMDLGKRLGLRADWTQRVVRQVGNYGELFERHLGQRSPLKLDRRLNNLSIHGGLHYAPSFR